MSRHQAREDRLRAGIHRAEQQAQQAHCHGVADQVGREPGEELQDGGADGEHDDEVLFADARRGVRKNEAAQCDASLIKN